MADELCSCYVNRSSIKEEITTPVMVSSSGYESVGGLIIYARAKPSTETEFAQVLLPVALSYETFVCKLCVALSVQRELVKKIVKLPDILIRSTEDVIRLAPFEKLELVLHSSLWKLKAAKKWQLAKPWLLSWFFVTFVAVMLTTAVTCQKTREIVSQLSERIDNLDKMLLRTKSDEHFSKNSNSVNRQTDIGNDTLELIVKRISSNIRNLEINLLNQLNEFDERFDRLNVDYAAILNVLNVFVDQNNKQLTKRKKES